MPEKEMQRRAEDSEDRDYAHQRKWHFDKTINISTITAIFSCAALLGGYVLKQDARLTTVEIRLENQGAVSAQVAKDLKEASRDVQAEIRQLRIEMMQFMRQQQGGQK